MVRLTDRPEMTLDVYRGRKTTTVTFCISLLLISQDKISFRVSQNLLRLKKPTDHAACEVLEHGCSGCRRNVI